MALKYRLILRPDMTKGAGKDSKLFYGQIRTQSKISFKSFCEMVSGHCTATKGEVELVIDGLIYVLRQQLGMGNSIQVGDFGSFRMLAGCKGTFWAKDFVPSLFKKGRIIFAPGPALKNLLTQASFEKLEAFSQPPQPKMPESEPPEAV